MSEFEERLDPQRFYPATHLFIRADERAHALEAAQVDHGKAIQDLQGQVKAVEERVNLGVARTGNENRADIQDLKTRVALMEREHAEIKKQLFDKDTGLIKQFDEHRQWQTNVNNKVTTFFIVQLAGALILWAVKHFH